MFTMSNNIYGQLVFFTFIATKQDGEAQHKRVRLGSVWCEREEAREKLEEFRAANKEAVSSREVHGRFVYEEHIG
jgi:hypothetical protein